MALNRHRLLRGDDLHVPGYRQSADPGAVGAGLLWEDLDSGILYKRNLANTDWELLTAAGLGENVNAKASPYNALGDNSNDDTAELLAAATAATGVAPLYIPKGTYLVSSSQALSGNLHIKGAGAHQTILKASTGGKFWSFDAKSHILIEDITFDINSTTNFVWALDFENCSHVIVRNCRFINSLASTTSSGNTMHGILARGCSYMWVHGNYSEGCQFKLAGVAGGADLDCFDNTFIDCTQFAISFVSTADGAIMQRANIHHNFVRCAAAAGSGGIYIGCDTTDPTRTVHMRDVSVCDNIFTGEPENNGEYIKCFFGLGTNRNVRIDRNIITDTTLAANTSVAGITVFSRVTSGTQTLRGLSVCDNQITDVTFWALNMQVTDGTPTVYEAVIQGNKVYGSRGIRVRKMIGGRIANTTLVSTNAQARINMDACTLDIVDNNVDSASTNTNITTVGSAGGAIRIESDTGETCRGLVAGNTITDSQTVVTLQYGIVEVGAGTLAMDYQLNKFLVAPVTKRMSLTNTTAIRLWNRNDDSPNATPSRHLRATKTWTPSIVLVNKPVSTLVTCTGAAAGDEARAAFSGLTNPDFRLSAIAATDKVYVMLDYPGPVPSVDKLTQGGDPNDAASFVTASVTLEPEIVYLLAVQNAVDVGTATTPTVTNWTSVATRTDSNLRRLTLFRRTVSAQMAGAQTIDFGGVVQSGCDWVLLGISGVDYSGTNGANAIVQSVTATGNGTALLVTLAAFSDTDNSTLGFFGVATVADYTVGSGFQLIAEQDSGTPSLNILAEYNPANDTSVDATAGGSGDWSGIAIELKASVTTSATPATGTLAVTVTKY